MATQINVGEVAVDVLRKNIKNIYLRVYAATGQVRISAPLRVNADTIRMFAVSKLGWILRQQQKIQRRQREAPPEHFDPQRQYLWGKRCFLEFVEADSAPQVSLENDAVRLRVRPGANDEKKQALLAAWYRAQVKAASAPLIAKWEPRLRVKVKRFYVRRMKTKWGSCTFGRGSIRLNTELAKKPAGCLEYVLVHEMVHLLEPSHNRRFFALMDQFLPDWQRHRDILNPRRSG